MLLVSRLIHLSNKVKRGGANTKWGCAMWAGNWKRFVIELNCEFVMACRKVKEVDKGTLVRSVVFCYQRAWDIIAFWLS